MAVVMRVQGTVIELVYGGDGGRSNVVCGLNIFAGYGERELRIPVSIAKRGLCVCARTVALRDCCREHS